MNSDTEKSAVREFVDHYFRSVRPAAAVFPIVGGYLSDADESLQELLALSHRRSAVSAYRKCLARCKKALIAADTSSLLESQSRSGQTGGNNVDQQILTTLKRLLPSAASSYEQALLDLKEQRLSYRGPATDLREALRELLDHLAPDEAVVKQQGFKLEPNTSGPTMKQKVRYILSQRGVSRTLSEPSERAASAVDEAIGTFVRSIYTRSNVSTHTPTDRDEVLRISDWVRVALCEILEIRAA